MSNLASPPRENLVRAVHPGMEFTRSADDAPKLRGHFAVFDRWTTIDSIWEGNFLERVAPGAFSKTIQENRAGMRVLFQHGKDPQIGDKPLGSIAELREDDRGAYYEVDMFDTSYNRDLIPGLEAGVYGASFRFRVLREDFNKEPGESAHNPNGLPERTIREAAVSEFGPVTWGAYSEASAAYRSVTDDYIVTRLLDQPDRLAELIQHLRSAAPSTEPTAPDPPADDPVTGDVSRRTTSRGLFLFADPPAHVKGQ